MDWKVLISPRARDDLKVIVRFIARDNPSAALKFGESLIQKSLTLNYHPWRGRMIPELNQNHIREIIFKS